MKNNQFTFILVAIFFLSTLCTVYFLYKFTSEMRKQAQTQTNLTFTLVVQRNMQMLGAEIMEYSKRNPAINELLQKSFGVQTDGKPAAATATPAAPAKPQGK